MEYEDFFANRLAKLRMKKGVSARDMSLSMGQSVGYINKIESRQNLPSMTGFFYICEYLEITPAEFFNGEIDDPQRIKSFNEKVKHLTEHQFSSLEAIVDAMLNPDGSDENPNK